MAKTTQNWKDVLRQKKGELSATVDIEDKKGRTVAISYGKSVGRLKPANPRGSGTIKKENPNSESKKAGDGHFVGRPSLSKRFKPGRAQAQGRSIPRDVRRSLAERGVTEDQVVNKNGVWVIRRKTPAGSSAASASAAKHGAVQKPSPRTSHRLPEPPWAQAAGKGIRFVGRCAAAKSAANWLRGGEAEQLSVGKAVGARRIRVILGLDFGTAYTKVVANVANDRYAITFEKVVDAGDPFLLPSVMSIGENEIACLGRHGAAVVTIDDLKLHFIERDDSGDQDAAFIAYMALVIRAARAWLFDKLKTLLSKRRIDWAYNLGTPTLPWEKDNLRSKYLQLLEAACLVSAFERPVSLRDCVTTLSAVRKRPTPLAERIEVFAEFAAQITGYVNSPRMREGPHLLVDVGAGTLDVTMFNVFQPAALAEAQSQGTTDMVADTRFPIWDARVERLGSYYLEVARSLVSRGQHSDVLQAVNDEKIESVAAYCRRTDAARKDVEQMEQQFTKYVAGNVAGVMSRTKVDRYPKFPWLNSPVPTFICGGGAHYKLYGQAVDKAAASFPLKLDHVPLPVPESLHSQGIGEELFDRLSVAYGLSFESMQIGQIVPSWKIPDDRKLSMRGRGPTDHDPTDRDQME